MASKNSASHRDRESIALQQSHVAIGTGKIDSATPVSKSLVCDEGIGLGSQMGSSITVDRIQSGYPASKFSSDDRPSKYLFNRKSKIGSATTSGYGTSLDEGIDSRQGNSVTSLHSYTYLYNTLLNVAADVLRPSIERQDLDELDRIGQHMSSMLAKLVDDGRKTITSKFKASHGSSWSIDAPCPENLDNYDRTSLSVLPEVTNLGIGEQQSLSSCSLFSISPNHPNSEAVYNTTYTTHGSQSRVQKPTAVVPNTNSSLQLEPAVDTAVINNLNYEETNLAQVSPVSSKSSVDTEANTTSTTDGKQESVSSGSGNGPGDSNLVQCHQEAISDKKGPNCSSMIVFPGMALRLGSLERISKLFTVTQVREDDLIKFFKSKSTTSYSDPETQHLEEHLSLEKLHGQETKFVRGSEVTSSGKLLHDPIQQNNFLNLPIQGSGTTRSCTLMCYNVANSSLHCSSQEIDASKIALTAATCRMFCFNNKIAVLIGKLNNKAWKLSLYYLDDETALIATWKLVSYFTLSIPEAQFDFKNSSSVSHKDGELIIVSILNDRITFQVFSKSVSGKKWASAHSLLSQTSTKFKIQSSTVLGNTIYCSLLQHGVGARICQFSIRLLQQHQKGSINVRPTHTWHIKDSPTLQNCFLSVHKGQVVIICCNDDCTKSIVEVKEPKSNSTSVSSALYRFEFPYIVKIVAASVAPSSDSASLTIAITYHDIQTNNCYVKRVDMTPC